MTEHTKAQRLADILQYKIPSMECLEEAAAELRRLDALNAELVEALKVFADCELTEDNCASLEVATKRIRAIARAALAKAKEQT